MSYSHAQRLAGGVRERWLEEAWAEVVSDTERPAALDEPIPFSLTPAGEAAAYRPVLSSVDRMADTKAAEEWADLQRAIDGGL